MSRRLPLHPWHVSYDAAFTTVNGIEVPLRYGSADAETAAIRHGAALADRTVEARYRVEADNSEAFLNELLTINVSEIEPGESRLAFLCNERGGIADMLLVTRADHAFFLLGSAESHDSTLAILEHHADSRPEHNAQVTDETETKAQAVILGPESRRVLNLVVLGGTVDIERGTYQRITIGASPTMLIRPETELVETYLLIAGTTTFHDLWEKLVDAVTRVEGSVVGYEALERVRIEYGFPRVGAELTGAATPFEIGQQLRVDLAKRRFLGKRALAHSTTSEFSRTMVCLRIDGEGVVPVNAEISYERIPIGHITSACMVSSADGQVAIGFVNSMKAIPGTHVGIASAGGYWSGEIVRPMFR